MRRKTIINLLLSSTLFSMSALAVDQKELISYTAQKHKAIFDKQEEKVKKELTQEYEKIDQLAQILDKDKMKEDADLKVIKTLSTVELWSKKFMQSYNPTDNELEDLYKTLKPKNVLKYNLRNILLSNEKDADNILNSLNKIKDSKTKLLNFKKYVKDSSKDNRSKQNQGLSGILAINKINPQIASALKSKKEGDIIKVNVKGLGTQVILIDKLIPESNSTFEESKNSLISFAKRKALSSEINLLLNKK